MRGTEYAELVAFIAVARERSFRNAAKRLGISPSALSRSIRDLEERLGVRLLNRSTRSMALTEAGASLLGKLSPAFDDIAAAVEAVGVFRDRPAGTVRLNMPRVIAHSVFVPELGRFAEAFPDVRLEIFAEDSMTDIVASGFDAGVRVGELLQRDMIAVRIAPDRRAVVGAPAYFATRPQPKSPSELREHACINYRFDRSGALLPWRFGKAGENLEVAVEGSLTVNDSEVGLAAALAGVGLFMTLKAHVADHVAAGRLVQVLEDWCPHLAGAYLYYPSRRQMSPALRAVIDFFRIRPS